MILYNVVISLDQVNNTEKVHMNRFLQFRGRCTELIGSYPIILQLFQALPSADAHKTSNHPMTPAHEERTMLQIINSSVQRRNLTLKRCVHKEEEKKDGGLCSSYLDSAPLREATTWLAPLHCSETYRNCNRNNKVKIIQFHNQLWDCLLQKRN